MDCCGEYRAHAHAPYTPWDYAHAPYTPLPYAHAQYYAPHDPYRYYRYDYGHHANHNSDHGMPMDYGAYASKEARVRRALVRRDTRALTPSHQIPLPHTPPLECGMGRPTYCEPQMWPHYQMGMGGGGGGGGGWSGANVGAAWMARNTCSREHMRYANECRPAKSPHHHSARQMSMQEGRSTPYPMYEDSSYGMDASVRTRRSPEEGMRERPREPRLEPPEDKRPPIVPLPAFQQAFGSTEIGKFAEAFSRTELTVEDAGDAFAFDAFPDWDAAGDPQWSTPPASREIKCEDNV